MKEILEKINNKINETYTTRIAINNSAERDAWNNGYDIGMTQGLVIAKTLFLSEQSKQKEPCEYCKSEIYERVGVEKSKYGFNITMGDVNQEQKFNYCPKCGRPLTQSPTDADTHQN